MVFDDIRRCDEHPVADFTDEAELFRFVRASRWVSVDFGGRRVLRLNWVVTALAVVVLWGFSISALVAPDDTLAQAAKWQSWVTQNFAWLYIGTQNVWAFFLLYVAFSKYGRLKLGRENERPEFGDISWFAMLFSCGIGVGVYYWGVSEPMYYYRGGALNKIPVLNDDDRAQMAIFTTLFHWGLHGWCPYIIVAVALGLVCYRWNMPLTMRSAFYPLLGHLVYSPLGDFIDALSIACTTFGVCTSLGFGVDAIAAGLGKLDGSFENTVDNQIALVWVITVFATVSISLGLHRGIQTLANFTFSVGLLVVFCLLFMDNTWFLLNSFVQSVGHYFQWVVQVGFQTDAWQQLGLEFSAGSNLIWGSSGDGRTGKLYETMVAARALVDTDEAMSTQMSLYGSHNQAWIDWWTIFYWGWWISWAPFVGMFIARISRGRTIRQVIIGSFIAPTAFSFFWLIMFGSLGIKMQRVAELALGGPDAVDWKNGVADCGKLGYVDSTPNSAAALALASEGYYALSCRAHADRLFDVLQPYGEATELLTILCVVGIALYFITSSDSGSYVDDIIAANGLPNPPLCQKVFWAFTEGAVASGLIKAGGSVGLSALQAVSICAGLPYTFALCYLCTSIWRGLKIDQGEADVCAAAQWSTGTLDAWDWFKPGSANDFAPARHGAPERVASLVRAVFCPFLGIRKAARALYDDDDDDAILDERERDRYEDDDVSGAYRNATARAKERSWRDVVFDPSASDAHFFFSSAFFALWIGFLCASAVTPTWAYVGWAWYMFMVCHVAFIRNATRLDRGIYGNGWEDLFCSICLYPAIVSQLELQAVDDAAPADVYGLNKGF